MLIENATGSWEYSPLIIPPMKMIQVSGGTRKGTLTSGMEGLLIVAEDSKGKPQVFENVRCDDAGDPAYFSQAESVDS